MYQNTEEPHPFCRRLSNAFTSQNFTSSQYCRRCNKLKELLVKEIEKSAGENFLFEEQQFVSVVSNMISRTEDCLYLCCVFAAYSSRLILKLQVSNLAWVVWKLEFCKGLHFLQMSVTYSKSCWLTALKNTGEKIRSLKKWNTNDLQPLHT